jgi:hypothetical protein
MSSGISFRVMTPDIKINTEEEASIGPIERKLSKSSVTRGDDQSIPSPPLSPYLSTDSGSSSALKSNTPTVQGLGIKQSDDVVETIIMIKNAENKEFPVNDFEKFPMVVNAWSSVGHNYKRSQLSFLRQYTNRSKDSRGVSKTNGQRKYAPRRIHKPVNYYNDNYNSDSDYSSQFEKVRTRRLVKESSQVLDSDISNISTPSPVKRRKATSSPAVNVHIDWESVPDFSPDSATLPNNNRCMKVEWKGQPMDLKNDPLVEKLHPAEVTLASILRLPCNLYLDSKRRLFAEKVARLRRGLPFRRTDAQKSCRIDVNKASRLFAAFEKIGWLEDDLFNKYL